MKKRDLLEIGIKLLAIYNLIRFLASIPVLGALLTQNSEHIINRPLHIIISCGLCLMYLIITLVLLSKATPIAKSLSGDAVSEECSPKNLSMDRHLSLGITLIGIYYFVSSASTLVSQIMLKNMDFSGSHWWIRTTSQLLILILSLIFIFKSGCVEKLINKYSDRNS